MALKLRGQVEELRLVSWGGDGAIMRWAGQPQSHFIDEYHLHFRPALFPNALCAEDLKE